ncbi:MAG: CHASE2 domain-containing protein [Halieaceae bacterium]|nr:CHASE2 domain-containing protein [Halieaceae bacterium]
MRSFRLLQMFSKLIYSLGFLSRAIRTQFFIGLAALFSLFTLFYFMDAFFGERSEQFLDYDAGSLDLAMDWRLSSPDAHPDIVIIDIDERSLAIMAEEYGRWPWPRAVMADFLAMLSENEPAAVGINVMYSDPDLQDLEGDQILDEIISYLPNAVFPMTRLSPDNDELSEVGVGMLPGVRLSSEEAGSRSISMLFTMFPAAQEQMGLNNLVIDDDGLVRRFQPLWLEENSSIPSFAYQMQRVSGADGWSAESDFSEYLINWRNKKETYRRISFVDVYQSMMGTGDVDLASLQGKYIVLGLTAPGLAMFKGTALSPVTDDNLIIATSIDDILSDTGLRTLPSWLVALISIGTFWTLAICYLKEVDDELIDLVLVIYEGIAVFITLGSISFTRYAFDLSYVAVSALAFYSLAVVYEIPAKGSMRAVRRFYDSRTWLESRDLVAIAFYDLNDRFNESAHAFQMRLGAKNVYQIDNLFSGESIASERLEPIRLLLLLNTGPIEDELAELDAMEGIALSRLEKSADEEQIRWQISEVVLQASLTLLPELENRKEPSL